MGINRDPESKIEICGTQTYWNNRNRQTDSPQETKGGIT